MVVLSCTCTLLTSHQGLLIAADPVSTPYTYEECSATLFLQTNICLEHHSVQMDSAPVTPSFTYSNQCSSVLLTSYLPVLVLGFSIQLMICFIKPVVFILAGSVVDTGALLRLKVCKGVLWPQHWARSAWTSEKRAALEKDPSLLLNPKSILCFDVLSNLNVILTFGLCSPILAFAAMCAVLAKMHMWRLLVGRFTRELIGDHDSDGGCNLALLVLGDMHFPLMRVLRRSFWLIAVSSSVFFSFVCWDIASDDVGWRQALWLPITTLCFPVLLWALSRMTRGRHDQPQPQSRPQSTRDEKETAETEMTPWSGSSTTAAASPLHVL